MFKMKFLPIMSNFLALFYNLQKINEMSSSELWPRKVELTHTFKTHDYHEYLHITMKLVITPTETSLTALIFLS